MHFLRFAIRPFFLFLKPIAGLTVLLSFVVLDSISLAEIDPIRSKPDEPSENGTRNGSLPSSFTSDTHASSSSNPIKSGELKDTGWLRALNPSQFPTRWEDKVVRFLEHYKDNARGRAVMKSLLERKNRFQHLMTQVLRDMELPEDLMYVSMVESGFDPLAKSPRGAAGLWQFVSRTGKAYGLEQNHWKDERLNPEKATRAAGTYLKMLYEKFGSWELSLAAYNMGHGALLRSIRKYNTNDFWVLARLEAALPYETVRYVSKILACAIIGHNQSVFGFENLELEEPWTVDEVKVPGGVSIRALAKAAKVSEETLLFYNPELRKNRTPPEKLYTLQLPPSALATFSETWPRMRPKQPAFTQHVFLFGESLSSVSKKFKIREQKLLSINEITDPEEIQPGFVLLVPMTSQKANPLSRKNTATNVKDEKPLVSIPRSRFVYENRTRVFFEIDQNTNLKEILSFFQVTEEDIVRWNHIDLKAKLQPGMILQLFVPEEVDLTQAIFLSEKDVDTVPVGTKDFFDIHEEEKGRERIAYTIQSGDTLISIAKRFEVSVGDLMRINQISKNALLQVGQRLFIYREKP